MIAPAVLLHPRALPRAPVGVLVQVAANHRQQRHQVERREHAHSDHELDQLGLVLLLQWDLHAHLVEGHNADEQQGDAHLGEGGAEKTGRC